MNDAYETLIKTPYEITNFVCRWGALVPPSLLLHRGYTHECIYLKVGDGGSNNCAQENHQKKGKVEEDQKSIFLQKILRIKKAQTIPI